jgi:hypothetical protein
MKSRIHPKYKTKYRITNWAEYDLALVKRGDITLWISEDAIDAWTPRPSGRRGAPRKYSDLAIETALTLRLVYRLPLRQAEGFLRSLLRIMALDLDAPDHTTLSRRSRQLNIAFKPRASAKAIDLIIDSTGLSIVGQGEWAAAKHGKRGKRGWRKLHIGVNGDGEIVTQVLTDSNVDDAKTGVELIEQVEGDIKCVIGDAAYDTTGIYDAAGARGAEVVVPPVRRAVLSRSKLPLSARDKTVLKVNMVGRREMEEEGRLQSARPSREYLLQIQADPGWQATCAAYKGARSRGHDGLQNLEPDGWIRATGLGCAAVRSG